MTIVVKRTCVSVLRYKYVACLVLIENKEIHGSMQSYKMANNEFKWRGRQRLWATFWHYSGFCLEGVRKSMQNSVKIGSRGVSDSETSLIPSRPPCSV